MPGKPLETKASGCNPETYLPSKCVECGDPIGRARRLCDTCGFEIAMSGLGLPNDNRAHGDRVARTTKQNRTQTRKAKE